MNRIALKRNTYRHHLFHPLAVAIQAMSRNVLFLVALIRDTHTLRIDTYFQYVSQYAIKYEYDT